MVVKKLKVSAEVEFEALPGGSTVAVRFVVAPCKQSLRSHNNCWFIIASILYFFTDISCKSQ